MAEVWVKELSPSALLPLEGLQGLWKRWIRPSEANGQMIFGLGELQPGEVAGWHEHPESEVFFVLEGAGEARWKEAGQERRADLRAGCAFYKTGHIPHQIRNVGTGPLRGVFFKAGGR